MREHNEWDFGTIFWLLVMVAAMIFLAVKTGDFGGVFSLPSIIPM